MSRRIRSLFYFVITVVIVVMTLKLINYLPTVIQTGTIRRYHSIEEVKSSLNIKDVYVPTYFPQGLEWPPSELLAQNKPFTAVIMEFKSAEKKEITMIISQSASANFKPDEKIRMQRMKERVSYPFKGRNMTLEAWICEDEVPCSRITWVEGIYSITVTAKSEPPSLMKIVESMIH
jgi:hypothetical protein